MSAASAVPSGASITGVPRTEENTYTIGSYGTGADEYTLATARDERDIVREWLKKGLYPNVEKKAQKARVIAAQAMTFEELADEWYAKAKLKWTSKKHIVGRRRTLDKDLLATLGSLPVADLEASPASALAALQRIEERGAYEMVAKARVVGSLICRYGMITNRMKTDPFAHLGAALKRPPVINRPTVPLRDMADLFETLGKVPAEMNTKLAFNWLLLTATRTAEMASPYGRKSRTANLADSCGAHEVTREHLVPLSTQAQAILKRARELRTSAAPDALLFPGFTRHGALSENAFLALLARAGYFGGKPATASARASPRGHMKWRRPIPT